MRSIREVVGGLLIAIISIGTVLGGIFLAITEAGTSVAVATSPPPTGPAPQPTAQPTLLAATAIASQTHTPTLTQTWTAAPTLIPTSTPFTSEATLTLTPALAFTSTPCLPPPNWALYTVQRGDTLFELSRRAGQSVDAIRLANCLVDLSLKTGQKIYLPRLEPTATLVVIAQPTETATPENTPTLTPIPLPLQILSITIANIARDSSSPEEAVVSVKVELSGGVAPYSIFEDGGFQSANPYSVVTQCGGTLVHTVQVVSADGQVAQQAYYFSPIVCP